MTWVGGGRLRVAEQAGRARVTPCWFAGTARDAGNPVQGKKRAWHPWMPRLSKACWACLGYLAWRRRQMAKPASPRAAAAA